VTAQIVRPQLDADKLPGLGNNKPRLFTRNRENALIGPFADFKGIFPEISTDLALSTSEAVGNTSRNPYYPSG
jgi:hypothetical protein